MQPSYSQDQQGEKSSDWNISDAVVRVFVIANSLEAKKAVEYNWQEEELYDTFETVIYKGALQVIVRSIVLDWFKPPSVVYTDKDCSPQDKAPCKRQKNCYVSKEICLQKLVSLQSNSQKTELCAVDHSACGVEVRDRIDQHYWEN